MSTDPTTCTVCAGAMEHHTFTPAEPENCAPAIPAGHYCTECPHVVYDEDSYDADDIAKERRSEMDALRIEMFEEPIDDGFTGPMARTA